MDAIVLVIHIVVSLFLVGLVLIQHGKGADAGAAFGGGGGGGASGSLFGSQGSASFLSRSSALLATVFFITSLTLAYLAGNADRNSGSVTDSVVSEQPAETEETPADLPDIP